MCCVAARSGVIVGIGVDVGLAVFVGATVFLALGVAVLVGTGGAIVEQADEKRSINNRMKDKVDRVFLGCIYPP